MTDLRPMMVLGCTSSAGKSLLTAALCPWYARQGVSVAPFEAQNMSTNARVVDGGEIGVAQWLQAKAARIEPDVRMNLPDEWAKLTGLATPCYEIRHGRVAADPSISTADGRVWADGSVLATTVHGCFEGLPAVAAITGVEQAGDAVDATLDRLADLVDDTCDTDALSRMTERG